LRKGIGIGLHVVASAVLVTAPAYAAKPPRCLEFDLSTSQPRGEKERGPACVRVVLNALRYEAVLGTEVTFTPGPVLALPFLPPIPGETSSVRAVPVPVGPPSGITAAPPDPFTAQLMRLIDELGAIDTRRTNEVERAAAEARAKVAKARDQLQAGVKASDAALQASGPAGVLAILERLRPSVQTGIGAAWPTDTVLALLADLDLLVLRLKALPLGGSGGSSAWSKWYQGANRDSYDWAMARCERLRLLLESMGPGSDPAKAMAELQTALMEWLGVLDAVTAGGANALSLEHRVDCGFSFNQTKAAKIELVKRDRLAPPTAVTREEVVTVECSTPISVSAGFGFSTVDEQDFGFVPFTKTGTDAEGNPTSTVVQHFALDQQSNFRPLPLLLINTRIAEPNETWALHGSLGAAVDVKSGESGTDIEFLVGPSISIKRSLFITLAFHAGRVPKLAGDFETGDEVPEGVSEPPLQKEWKPGVALTFTMRIKP
jgi:hypothetical protein